MQVILYIHPIVDDWIDHGIGHCEPIEGQVDVLDVVRVQHPRVVVLVQEECLLGEPAQGEDHDDHYEHPDHL